MIQQKQIFSQNETYFNPDYTLFNYPEAQRLQDFNSRLALCGKWATKTFSCKKDLSDEHDIKVTHSRFFCEIRYCDCPDCLVQRFARQLNTFQAIKRFDGLKTLWHFSIGFNPIELSDFKKNFTKHKKRQEYVLNKYFERLRKQKGINVQAVRVLDFAFTKENQVYMHYHFGALPLGRNAVSVVLSTMKNLEKGFVSRQRSKTPFHLQSYGLRSRESVVSYLSIRASGMYKYNMTENVDYKPIQGDLRASIENHKYLLLSDILTKEEYLNSFYNKSHFVCIGGLPRPHGSSITDSIPNFCPIHGHLERSDVRIRVTFDDMPQIVHPPPDFDNYQEEKLVIQLIKIP